MTLGFEKQQSLKLNEISFVEVLPGHASSTFWERFYIFGQFAEEKQNQFRGECA